MTKRFLQCFLDIRHFMVKNSIFAIANCKKIPKMSFVNDERHSVFSYMIKLPILNKSVYIYLRNCISAVQQSKIFAFHFFCLASSHWQNDIPFHRNLIGLDSLDMEIIHQIAFVDADKAKRFCYFFQLIHCHLDFQRIWLTIDIYKLIISATFYIPDLFALHHLDGAAGCKFQLVCLLLFRIFADIKPNNIRNVIEEIAFPDKSKREYGKGFKYSVFTL